LTCKPYERLVALVHVTGVRGGGRGGGGGGGGKLIHKRRQGVLR